MCETFEFIFQKVKDCGIERVNSWMKADDISPAKLDWKNEALKITSYFEISLTNKK